MGVNKKYVQPNNTRGEFISESKIYDGVFWQKKLTIFAKISIIDVQVDSKYFPQ